MGKNVTLQHKDLASGRWQEMRFVEQMANIASEVERSLKWKEKNNAPYSEKALERALELLDMTLEDPKNKSRLREIARVRETLSDYFYGNNQYASTPASWRSYFSVFTFAARKTC